MLRTSLKSLLQLKSKIREVFLKGLKKFKVRPLTSRHRLGQWGETLAAQYLEERGFKVLVRNWRYKKDEIDIICLKDNVLVFVEVRTRQKANFLEIYRSIDSKKKKALKRASKNYLNRLTNFSKSYRFDIVLIEQSTCAYPAIKHFTNIAVE